MSFKTDTYFLRVRVFQHRCVFSGCACFFLTMTCIFWLYVFSSYDVYFLDVRVLQKLRVFFECACFPNDMYFLAVRVFQQ